MNNKPNFIMELAVNEAKAKQVVSARITEMLTKQFALASKKIKDDDIAIPSMAAVIEQYLIYTIAQIKEAIASDYQNIPDVMTEQKQKKTVSVRVSDDVVKEFNELNNKIKEKNYSVPLSRVFEMATADVFAQIKEKTGFDYTKIDYDEINNKVSDFLAGLDDGDSFEGCESCGKKVEELLKDTIINNQGAINRDEMIEEIQCFKEGHDCEKCDKLWSKSK